MANPLPCDMCEAEMAAVIVTNLENGDTMTVGPSCLPILGAQWCGHNENGEPAGEPVTDPDLPAGQPGLEGMPAMFGIDPAALLAEAEAEARAELEAEAAANAAETPPEGGETAEGTDTPSETAKAASGALGEPESAV